MAAALFSPCLPKLAAIRSTIGEIPLRDCCPTQIRLRFRYSETLELPLKSPKGSLIGAFLFGRS